MAIGINIGKMVTDYQAALNDLDPVKDAARIAYIKAEIRELQILKEVEQRRLDVLMESFEVKRYLSDTFMSDILSEEWE